MTDWTLSAAKNKYYWITLLRRKLKNLKILSKVTPKLNRSDSKAPLVKHQDA